MLQAINDKAKGLIGGIIILFISVPFALWGIQEYIGGAEQPYAAKVNDIEISLRDYEESLARQRQRLESALGDKVPTDAAFEKTLKRQVLDQLITQRVLEQLVTGTGYSIPDTKLAQQIHQIEAFQQDGNFVASMYQGVLSSQGMSPAEFEYLFRRDLMVKQLQDAITKSAIVDNATLETLDRLQNQTRNISYLLFKQSAYMPEISLTGEEVSAYFSENQDRYMHPEKVSVSYIELTANDLAVNTPVNEEDLRRQYDEYVASLSDNEQRKARHILIQVSADADDAVRAEKQQKLQGALNKVKAGGSFEELAKSLSEDPGSASNGGDLGWVSKGMMVPAFEEALYKLNKGEVSDVVTSSFGYHIIKLDDIKGETPVPFAEKKAELVKQQQQHSIDNEFYERSELLATLAYENDQTLQPAAEALGLTIKQTDLFTRTSGQDVAQHEAVRKAAFAEGVIKEGRNSDIIEVSKNHVVVLRMQQHEPTKAMSLKEVQPSVELALKSVKAREKAQAAALQALADLQSSRSLENYANDQHVEVKKLGEIKRNQSDVDQRIVISAFSMAKPESGKTEYDILELSNGIAVIALHEVKAATEASKPAELQMARQQLETNISNQEMSAMLDYLRDQSDIMTGKDLF